MKRLVAFLLIALAAISTGQAQTSNGPDSVTWTYALMSGPSLIIRGKGSMRDYSPAHPAPGSDSDRKRVRVIYIADSVSGIGAYAFDGFEQLEEVKISSPVTRIGQRAFGGCRKLQSIRLDCAVPPEVHAEAFLGADTSTRITVPRGAVSAYKSAPVWRNFSHISTVQTGVTGDVSWAYDNATNVLTISGRGAMGEYDAERTSPWEGLKDSIKEIVVEDGVTSIDRNAFDYCPRLTAVVLPQSVTLLWDASFENCPNLRSLTVNWATPPVLSNYVFAHTLLSEVTLTVPRGARAAYQSAPVWKDFAHITEVANRPDPEGTKVYAVAGALRLVLPRAADVHIYNVEGRLVRSFRSPAGEATVALPRGIYIVQAAGLTEKVAVE